MADSDRLKNLLHHAKRFGPEGVMQCGVEFDLSFAELVKLQKACDEAAVQKNRFAPKPRVPVETRVKRLLGIEEDDAA